jgi:hypothetical protein
MISQCLLSHEETAGGRGKYALVDSILSARNYYECLGLTNDSTSDEIRKAYIEVLEWI